MKKYMDNERIHRGDPIDYKSIYGRAYTEGFQQALKDVGELLTAEVFVCTYNIMTEDDNIMTYHFTEEQWEKLQTLLEGRMLNE